MSTYAIGDVQGCYTQLQQLLEKISFDPAADRLWFAGDLVNRGPDSLQVLRFVHGLGEAAITVLGNHDLHLLAAWQGRQRHFKHSDTLQEVLAADDCDELCNWLRQQPLLHHDPVLDYLMIHAGLPPEWDLSTARRLAHELETVLRGNEFPAFIEHMYGNQPARWDESLQGWERLRFAVNCFTRLRFCHADGTLDFTYKGSPDTTDGEILPWFSHPRRCSQKQRIVFGHWSTLGLYHGHNVHAIDSGCLWGGALTALRLEDESVFQQPCPASRLPGKE